MLELELELKLKLLPLLKPLLLCKPDDGTEFVWPLSLSLDFGIHSKLRHSIGTRIVRSVIENRCLIASFLSRWLKCATNPSNLVSHLMVSASLKAGQFERIRVASKIDHKITQVK